MTATVRAALFILLAMAVFVTLAWLATRGIPAHTAAGAHFHN